MYLVTIHATFADKADADHVFNQALSVATNASVARIGQAGERTSHGAVFNESENGTLTIESQFHKDRFGIVRRGNPENNDAPPAWVQPTGSQDAYPLLDIYGNPVVVMHDGESWQNQSNNNTQAPGVFGWLNLSQPEMQSESYPAWTAWSGLNEDLHQVGDRVTHNGSDWEATTGNNHWEPGEFGWVQI